MIKRKPLDLPPAVAKAFVKDMRLLHCVVDVYEPFERVRDIA
jgi:hypothetical protein